jgi:hypothetical protein
MGLTFYTPNINLVKDPRWGRAQEVYSEVSLFFSSNINNEGSFPHKPTRCKLRQRNAEWP